MTTTAEKPQVDAGRPQSGMPITYTMAAPCADLAERLARVYAWALKARQTAGSTTAEADRV